MTHRERQSLKETLRSSWVVLASVGIAVSVLAFSLVSYFDFRKSLERIEDDLKIKSVVIDRRVSAEQLGGRKAVTENVIQDLVRWYDLGSIQVVQGVVPCDDQAPCIKKEGSSLVSFRKLSESLTGDSFLEIRTSIPTFWSCMRWSYLFSVFIPIFGLFIVGIYLQRKILNRSLIEPINSLVANSYHGEEPPSQWPTELADLSNRLEHAFRERDQAMIGQLASGVLHDIKTYLHSVSLATDLASEKKGTERYAARLESLYQACYQQVPKMKAILESVLDGSREISVHPVYTSLLNLVNSTIIANQELSAQNNVKVEVQVSPDIQVGVDPVQFERAVSNLVKNAIEATAEKLAKEGSASALLNSVKVSAVESSFGIELSVEDSGSGVGQNAQKVFEKVKTTKTHGTGLGLLITRKIVEAHHGKIDASKSNVLGGAKFTIQIPSKPHEGGQS